MSDSKYNKYKTFTELFRKAHPNLPREENYKKGNCAWNDVKNLGDEEIEKEILRFKTKIAATETKQLSFWSTLSSPPTKKSRGTSSTIVSSTISTPPRAPEEATPALPQPAQEVVTIDDEANDGDDETTPEVKKPAQLKAQQKIAQLNKQIVSLTELRASGMSSVTVEQIESVRKELAAEEATLKRLRREAARLRKFRAGKRSALEKVAKLNISTTLFL